MEAPAPRPKVGGGAGPGDGSSLRSQVGAGSSSSSAQLPPALAAFRYPEWVSEVSPAAAAEAQRRERQQRKQRKKAREAEEDGVADEDKDTDDEDEGDEEDEDEDEEAEAEREKPWRLEVLKNGVPLGFESLMAKPVAVVGRQSGGGSRGAFTCELLLEHPSIRRAHAVFLHHRNGSLFLADLGSTHGTKVNKQPLKAHPPPSSEESSESSSSSSGGGGGGGGGGAAMREVRPGDVVKFGESTRLFIVHGPERYRPPELESEVRKRMHSYKS